MSPVCDTPLQSNLSSPSPVTLLPTYFLLHIYLSIHTNSHPSFFLKQPPTSLTRLYLYTLSSMIRTSSLLPSSHHVTLACSLSLGQRFSSLTPISPPLNSMSCNTDQTLAVPLIYHTNVPTTSSLLPFPASGQQPSNLFRASFTSPHPFTLLSHTSRLPALSTESFLSPCRWDALHSRKESKKR